MIGDGMHPITRGVTDERTHACECSVGDCRIEVSQNSGVMLVCWCYFDL